MLDVNLVGPWRVTSAALPALRASRGRVVNVASGLAHITVPFATAYTLCKRGVVAYSDSLRLEEGDRITVTTVYPGYIRTRIHERSTAAGVPLEGAVPVERVEDAARTLVRAALGPPARDLATTRQGGSATRSCGCAAAARRSRDAARRCAVWPGAGTSRRAGSRASTRAAHRRADPAAPRAGTAAAAAAPT